MRSEEFALKLKNLPDSPGCYLMKSQGRVIYVGKAVNLKNRVRQYFQSDKNHTPKVRAMVEHVDDFDIVLVDGEMEALAGALCVLDDLSGVRVDFSVVNDLDYYNGLVFQGYVKGIPRAVMSGGRYDNMMRRLNKPQNALGFALYLDELERALREVKPYDVDAVLLYGNARPEAAAQAAANSPQPFMLSWSVSAASPTPFFMHMPAMSAGEISPSE